MTRNGPVSSIPGAFCRTRLGRNQWRALVATGLPRPRVHDKPGRDLREAGCARVSRRRPSRPAPRANGNWAARSQSRSKACKSRARGDLARNAGDGVNDPRGGLLRRRQVCRNWSCPNKQRVCIIHTMRSADLIRELERAGWVLKRVRGSPHVFVHPQRRGIVVVPHPKRELGVGLVAAIRKQAGL